MPSRYLVKHVKMHYELGMFTAGASKRLSEWRDLVAKIGVSSDDDSETQYFLKNWRASTPRPRRFPRPCTGLLSYKTK